MTFSQHLSVRMFTLLTMPMQMIMASSCEILWNHFETVCLHEIAMLALLLSLVSLSLMVGHGLT